MLFKQLNDWSCTPTAFSIVTGISYNDLIKEIGHDGSEIISDKYDELNNRRGFLIQECILAVLKFGFATISFDPLPAIILPDGELYGITKENDKYIKQLLKNNYGVLSASNRHSYAWMYDYAYCPTNGIKINIDKEDFHLDKFYMIKRIK